MDTVSRTVGRCLTETKLKDFDVKAKEYVNFFVVSQFNSMRPKHLSDTGGTFVGNQPQVPRIDYGSILYGVEQDGSLTWLGEIIDSSD